MPVRFSRIIPLLLAASILSGGCASAPAPATVIRTAYDDDQGGFSRILVIGVAGDYDSRASFETALVQQIGSEKVVAQPFFTVIGRRPQLTRAYLQDAIRAREFDAVLFTRLKGQEQENLAPGRPVGAAFDLFGYDYLELNRDEQIRKAGAITFVTEMYSTATERKVWAIETLSLDKATASELITEQAYTIARQLRDDDMLAR